MFDAGFARKPRKAKLGGRESQEKPRWARAKAKVKAGEKPIKANESQ